MSYDWSQFTKRINIKSSTREVYNAWTTRNNIESWFLRRAEFSDDKETLRQCDETIQAGDTYKWMWHGYPDSVNECGKILKANGSDMLQFTFSGPADSPMIVTVSISTEENESVVTIKQENIPIDEEGKKNFHIGCGEGWTFYLANLKSILEGGIDLRNRNEKLTRMINS